VTLSRSRIMIEDSLLPAQHLETTTSSNNMSIHNTARQILGEAQIAFRRRLHARDRFLYTQISKRKAAEDIYRAIAKLQEKLAPQGLLRGLGRLKPLLDRLSEFSFLIEALLSPDSDQLSLIWGPIEVILTDSSHNIHLLSKHIQMLATVGDALPNFGEIAVRFPSDGMVRELLASF